MTVCCEPGAARVPCPMDASPSPELPARDSEVLTELAREEAHVAFQGLRRRLGLHQQALTRTLRRLEQADLVTRGADGYRLTDQGCLALCDRDPSAPASTPRETRTLVQALLPNGVDAATVSDRLAGRWFGTLRWYGTTEIPGETTLTWLTAATGARVRARVAGGVLTLEAEQDLEGDDAAPYRALRPLVAALADLYAATDAPETRAAA